MCRRMTIVLLMSEVTAFNDLIYSRTWEAISWVSSSIVARLAPEVETIVFCEVEASFGEDSLASLDVACQEVVCDQPHGSQFAAGSSAR